ncbi:MAG TPA: glycosyltransferase family 2 protein [bacterium]|nr:glycosyltransferase family 2 protein [bacterium]
MAEAQIKISGVVLAKDEEETIGAVVTKARPLVDELLVVDGHSSDRTREIAEAAGARVVSDHGRGKGDGYRAGLSEARGEVVVFLDADGSHDPADIPKLVAPIVEGRLDMVVASRWRGGSDDVHPNLAHFVRDLGGNFLSMIISHHFQREVTDCLNGFRALRRSSGLALGLESDDFDIEHEMVMKALKQGLRVGEVGSHEYARAGGVSKLPTFRKAHKFFLRLFKEW